MPFTVAVLGAGAGGAATAADLAARDYRVRLWTRSEQTIAPYRAANSVAFRGVLGDGEVGVACATTDLGHALEGADVAVVSMPSTGHEHVARALAAAAPPPLVLNPGQTGSALRFRAIFAEEHAALPPLAELSTLAYVARLHTPGCVTVSGVARCVRAACLPNGEEALDVARELFPAADPVSDVLATALANVNLVLHPPGAILGASWVEATGGAFRFYVDGTTAGVARVMAALDEERLAAARAFGHELPPLADEMASIGTADVGAAARGDLRGAIVNGEANREIRAPDSLEHRYYREDFGFGVVPFLALADAGGVTAPVAEALLRIASTLLGVDLGEAGLNAERLGIAGLDREALRMSVQRAEASR
ncbi:MAG: NAD/NADP octopine/nopaline dehydrogenase family protein [Gaiellaceae bacterium]